MKAVVLAGGYATRLWPITRNRPKMLLPVGETTVLDRILDELESEDRVEEVYLSTNERFASSFREHLDQTNFHKPRLSIEETTAEGEKFGVIGALAQLVKRENLVGDGLVVVAGDNLISFDLSDFLDFFEIESEPTLVAYDVGSREQARSYGVVDIEDDRVTDFQEKPDEPPSTLVSIACYAFPADAIRFEKYLNQGNNPDEPGWFVQWLVDRRYVYGYTFNGVWFDIGTPESYLEAMSWALDERNIVDKNATVENSEIGPNVHLMGDATARNAELDRTILFPEATVENATVRDSLIDTNALVRNIDISGALVGGHSQIH